MKNASEKPRAIRISTLNYAFLVLVMLFAFFLSITGTQMTKQYRALVDEYEVCISALDDARRVQGSCDYQSGQCRSFVMTGDAEFLDAYCDEADHARTRDEAIADIATLPLTPALADTLNNAMKNALSLTNTEQLAMHYAAAGYGFDETGLPDAVRDAALDPAFTTPEQKLAEARRLAFGEDYNTTKANIHTHLDDAMDEIEKAVAELEKREGAIAKRLTAISSSGLAIVLPLSLTMFIVVATQLISPLNKAVKNMAAGKRVEKVAGTQEIRYLMNTYNEFYDESSRARNKLRQEAEYDALTNLRNRTSYEKTCAALSESTVPLAAVIVDIDHFKQVNDNYGHIIGDLALQKVAKLLHDSFRSDDMVFRIGGDEFAVILLYITAANANAVSDKINAIRKAIGTPDENGVPALSVSAGCAFSPAGMPEDLMRRADAALYEKKHTSEVGFAPTDENQA